MTLSAKASEASRRVRIDRGNYRSTVAAGDTTLRELLLGGEIPGPVASVRAFQVATWPFAHSLTSGRHSPLRGWQQLLNYHALRNAVNVFEEVGRLNDRQREWLVSYIEQNPATTQGQAAA